MPNQQVVIVGAGHAGGAAAAALRRFGFVGNVTMLGAEPFLPYQRPPLSKAALKANSSPYGIEQLYLQPESFYRKTNIVVRKNVRAARIEPRQKFVELSDGELVSYDQLILATGARPRALDMPVQQANRVHVLRDWVDAVRLRTALMRSSSLAIVGGGYIGLEVAAIARARGLSVTILERESRVLARVASPPLSAFFAATHRAQGVCILNDVIVVEIESNGVRLQDGRLIVAQCVLVAIGAVPNDELARAAGIDCASGVCVDLAARTSADAVYAIGDVTCRPLPIYGRNVRLESVPNAIEQAKQAAAAICGTPAPAAEVPWFWSDQYTIKLQIAGLIVGDETRVIRGDLSSERYAIFHLQGNAVVAVEAVNMPTEFMVAKQLISSAKDVNPHHLGNLDSSPKAWLT